MDVSIMVAKTTVVVCAITWIAYIVSGLLARVIGEEKRRFFMATILLWAGWFFPVWMFPHAYLGKPLKLFSWMMLAFAIMCSFIALRMVVKYCIARYNNLDDII